MDYYEERDNVCDFQTRKFVNTGESEIRKFFTGKSVFITGATGLIGSLLLEHILRLCPEINKAYLLLRPKKDKTPEERLNSLFESEVFCKVRTIHEHLNDKIHIVNGDIALPWCGLSESDKQLLIENVDMVYHAAAALRMDEHIRNAYYMNVRATEHLLEIGMKMKKLKAFIYVSTAYSHDFLSEVSEKFYDTQFNSDELKALVDLMGDVELAAMTPKFIGRWRDTYAFTKAIAEEVTQRYADRIPVAVVRPSIVIGCEKEPLAAWINNIYGATGVSAAASVGIMRVWYGGRDIIADIIPADKATSATLAISWQIGKYFECGNKIETPVYNIVSSAKSPQTWTDYMTYTESYAKYFKIVSKRFIRLYNFHIEERYWVYRVKTWIYHLLFGIIVDQILKYKGKQPMLLRGFIKIHNFNMALSHYCTRHWVYTQDNMDKLWSEMTSVDKHLFNFDMTDFKWKEYHSRTIRGIAVYIFKDDLSDMSNTIKRYLRTEVAINCFKYFCYGIVAYCCREYIMDLYSAISRTMLWPSWPFFQ